MSDTAGARFRVYIGTYTRGESEGIYVYHFDAGSGALEPVATATAENPSFLALHPNGRFLYAVSELAGDGGGRCLAFAVADDGGLTPLGGVPTRGDWPCHLSIAPGGDHVLVTNYAGGSVAVFPIREDGTLAAASDFVQHEGASVHPERQQQPHPHSIVPAPDGYHVVVPDLGLDRVVIYGLDHGRLTPGEQPWAEVAPGSGPRHFAFHPNGRWGYVINELNGTVTALRFTGGAGSLEPIQTVPTLPDGFDAENYTAEIQVHPSGRFVYGSNRGHDSIVIFAVDPETGQLEPRGREPSRGGWPRTFGLEPEGRFLLAANQHGDNLVVFAVDPETGQLELLHEERNIPSPVCVRVVPA